MSSKSRIQRLRESLDQCGLDAILISGAENRCYLSGFTGSFGYLIVSFTDTIIVTDFRYVEQASQQSPGFRVERVSGKSDWLPELADELGVKKLGFEARYLTVADRSGFQKSIDEYRQCETLVLIDVDDVVDLLRVSKDENEVQLLTHAIEITDQAFEVVAPDITPGVTEASVAWELEKAMRERGASGMAFDIIVGAGSNGALPHHLADESEIRCGEPVVIDMGARYDGYCADLTRTVFIGEPDRQFLRVYDVVLRAQLAAEESVIPGMTGGELDAIARGIIRDAGYGENFGHSLGHGVGLAVHEFPRIGPGSEDRLEEGMVFTIEPGVYLSGWGGVRIEDVVVLERGCSRVISSARKLFDLGVV